jgi:DNA-directed RNA polymerase specialized sigma24 family protein
VQRDLLDRALGRLQPDARALVVLVHDLGLTVPDAADALGTAKSRLSRTLAAMRASMGVDAPVSTDPARRFA